MEISDDTIIYDIETDVKEGKPNPEKDKFRIFGCYSYKTNKDYVLQDIETVRKINNNHKYLVGFNNK